MNRPDPNFYISSQNLAAFLPIVHTAMKELNVLVSTQVANNTSYQQAMYAGAINGFYDTEMLDLN